MATTGWAWAVSQFLTGKGGTCPLLTIRTKFGVELVDIKAAGFTVAAGQVSAPWVAPPGPFGCAGKGPFGAGKAKGGGKGSYGAGPYGAYGAFGVSPPAYAPAYGKAGKGGGPFLAPRKKEERGAEAKQRRHSEGSALAPPDNDKIAEIIAFLEENGGHASLAITGSKFGLRLPQFERANFVVGPTDINGQRSVAPPGSDEPPPPDPARGAMEAPDEETVALVSAYLMEEGGVATLEQVNLTFNLRMRQLVEAGFVVGPPDVQKQRCVAIPGSEPPPPPGGSEAIDFAAADPDGEARKPKKRKGGAGPGNDIDPESDRVTSITAFLEEQGGIVALAVIGSKFRLRLPQIEQAGFVIGPQDETGQRCVALPGMDPPPPPGPSTANPDKLSNKQKKKRRTEFDDDGNCLCCGEAGHRKIDCPHLDTGCQLCGMKGHIETTCRRVPAEAA
jgi:hypothetical protein